jgi:ElaB/YqjD/DUF883 family membrane-anchored ribosome-binding protein
MSTMAATAETTTTFPTSPQMPGGVSSAVPEAGGGTLPTDHFTRTTSDGDMLSRVVRGAHDTIDRLADSAAPHVQRLQQGVGVRAEHVKEVGDEWAESLRCTVRDNPLAAVATALAVGVLIARLTQR